MSDSVNRLLSVSGLHFYASAVSRVLCGRAHNDTCLLVLVSAHL